jgi:hypothetical protein
VTAPASRRPLWPTLIVVVGSVALVSLFLSTWGNRDVPTAGTDVSPAASAEASPTATPADASPRPTGEDEPTEEPASPSPDPDLLVPVVVVNQASQPGLGERAATAIEALGWSVDSVEDASLAVPSTTLYVPPGLEESAAAFQQSFPAVERQRPAFDGLATSALTLVLADPDAADTVRAMEADSRVLALGSPWRAVSRDL